MATMQMKRMSLLLLALLTFQLANAIPKSDVENLCRETTDAAFCMQQIDADPRIEAARDLGDVLTIALSQSNILVDDATTHLTSVTPRYNGPNGRRRIGDCKKKYETASAKFQAAWERCVNKAFREVDGHASVGAKAVTECENGWKRGGPPQNSPLTLQNTNVSKMYGIVQLLVGKLAPPP